MKTLFLDHAGVLGGAELFLLEVAKAFRPDGSVILLANGPFEGRLRREGVEVEILAAPSWVTRVARGQGRLAQILAAPGILALAWKVARRARHRDVIFANSQKALIVGALASIIARKPLVWYLHDILTSEHFSAANRRVSVAFGNRFASRIITNSQASRAAFIEAGGRAEVIHVIYNGLDASAFTTPSPADRAKLRATFGIDGAPIVSVFSRLTPWKGQHVLIEALRSLPEVHTLLVGAPLFGNEIQYQHELEAQVKDAGLAERVHFLGFREDVSELLGISDIVAHTSISPEPFGRVIVEGMLAGKPVIATRGGGASEIIEDHINGRLVTPGDPAALAEAIQALIGNPGRGAELAAAGRTSATERFTVAEMVRKVREELALAVQA